MFIDLFYVSLENCSEIDKQFNSYPKKASIFKNMKYYFGNDFQLFWLFPIIPLLEIDISEPLFTEKELSDKTISTIK